MSNSFADYLSAWARRQSAAVLKGARTHKDLVEAWRRSRKATLPLANDDKRDDREDEEEETDELDDKDDDKEPSDDKTPGDDEEKEDEGEQDEDEDEDVAIASSADAKANPQLAMAAIEAGLTLAQFREVAAAVAARPRGHNVLHELLKDSLRLGPDVTPRSATVDTKQIYARRREAIAK